MRITRRRDRQRRRWRSATAALGAAILSATLLVPAAEATASAVTERPAAAPAAAGPARAGQAVTEEAATEPPRIVRTTSDAGFSHPGVGLTADHLENARTQVLAGVEPWASYYEAMTRTGFASRTFTAQNAGPSDDQPLNDAYDAAGMRSRALNDGVGALTQALRYVITGDEVYRANALHAIRTWSSMDPAKYRYFPDAHIHTGEPLYKMLAAAEIIRSTTPVNDSLDGYDLRWTDRDQQRIEDNLIRPVLDTFLFSQNRLWNQHLYGVVGMVAAAIFLDDAELYAERVEWYTVNSTYTSEHTINGGDVNGSLAALFRVIDSGDPLNPYGHDFVQHIEMGRDQAHAAGDVDILTALARIVHNQGTRLDPVDGTVSTAADAVTPYEFLGNRTLAGGDVFAAFMLGEDVPYIDTSGGSGKLSQAYRGRLIDPAGELYYQYKYVAGVDVEAEAPYVAEAFAHRDGPRFYNGTGVANFWNLRGSDFNAAEYWVAFPPQLADENVVVPPLQNGPELDVARFGHAVGAGAQAGRDGDGTGYVRLDATAGDGYVAVRRAAWPGRNGTALVGFKVRTQATATLEVRPTPDAAIHATVTVPDTGGAWRYVTLDIDQARYPVSPVGSNIVFLSAVGAAPVDVAGVLAQANGTLTPVVFDDGDALAFVAVSGEPIARTLATSGGAPDTLTLQDAPSSASLAADGTLTWTPGAGDAGTHRFVVVGSHGQADTALPVAVTVAPDRAAAIDASLDGLREPAVYTAVTWNRVAAARDAARAGIEGAGAGGFAALLDDLRVAVDGLALLDPRLPDGTLDFSRLVDSPLTTPILLALVDGDNQTTWGDRKEPSVVLDFGVGYRVRADAFGFLARDTFPNRGEGTNVYGSDDGETWTLLTEHPSAGDDVAIEEVPVREEARDNRFRYLKLQVDKPGPPTDPAYPGLIWTLADFRIHGERTEVGLDTVLELADAVDLTPYSRASRILFTREVEAVRAAAAKPGADTRALAARLLVAWDLLEPVPVGTAEVRQPWVTASTPSWDGRRDAAANGWAMFDGDPTTFTDTTQSSGWVSVIPDDGSTFTVETVHFLPRSGYASRANGVQFQGSDDGGATWRTFAAAGTVGSDSWQEIVLDEPVTVGALRVLAGSGNTNLAEVELVRSVVDTTAVRLYLDETAELREEDWKRAGWARLAEAREAAAAVVGDGADPTQEEADAAADALAEAASALKPSRTQGGRRR